MILQALYELAQREGLILDPDFEPKPVAWLVHVSQEGRFLGIMGTHSTLPAHGKRKPVQVAKTLRIPRQPTGRSGTKAPASFFVDNAKYVFGLPTKGTSFSSKEGEEKARSFRELVAGCASSTGDEGARAVLALLDSIRDGETKPELPTECRSNDLFAFQLISDGNLLVHERPAVKEYWMSCRRNGLVPTARNLTCLVSGSAVAEPNLFPLIENVPGANPSRIGLVSFNKQAFESYGWKGNENAPISRDAAEACATALNRLLDPAYPNPHRPEERLPQRSLRLSADTAVCYWAAKESGDDFCSVFGGLLEANPEAVRNLYQSVWSGKAPDIEEPSVFYALTLTGTQGRAIVRDWFESTVARVALNLSRYFEDIRIVRHPKLKRENLPPQMPLPLLLKGLAPQGDDDKIPIFATVALVEAALHGTPFPLSLLQRALERQRAEIGRENDEPPKGYRAMERSDARAALIKAVLNRRKRLFPTITRYEEVNPDMDPNNTSEGYALGRLMAVLERIQQQAIPEANATIVDRYFSGASAAPKTVFVRLLKNARHHVSKGKDDGARAGLVFRLDKLVDELASRFDPKRNGFPAHLDLEQQGLFVLGYHQMRKWLWMPGEERERWEAGHPEAPREYIWSKAKE